MMQHHGYSLTEIEEMHPFERDIYISQIAVWIKEQEARRGGSQPGGLYNVDGSLHSDLGGISKSSKDHHKL